MSTLQVLHYYSLTIDGEAEAGFLPLLISALLCDEDAPVIDLVYQPSGLGLISWSPEQQPLK